MKKYFKKLLLVIIVFLLAISTTACGLPGLSSAQGGNDTIRITALTTTESQIVANIVSQLIGHETHYKTSIVNNLGSAPMQHQALYRHNADIQAAAYDGGELTANLGMPAIKNSKKANDTVRYEVKKRWDQTYLPTYGFSDNYAFMVKPEEAKKYNLKDISDLKKVEDKYSLGVASEWVNAPGVGYKEFEKAYGLSFPKMRAMNIELVYSALQTGRMNVVLGYSTDGRIDSYHLKLLKDNRHFFPPYNCGMLINNYVLREHPDLKPILRRLVGRIGMHTIRHMNYEVDDELLEPSTVAHQFLVKNNYFRDKK
ncbi:glycine betaine ABC transporter substrate-binding protein [Lactobacillus acetotolerans]|uniref:glycine betaine ABC transporter substrate-binding protein n=1 Tax=Lactobacillus acetotolerans TaxID=1600 RepID=UPI001451B735|nr:glycine betaine ABC transporter substrate-binding protein [Lactobacillus acetotolerans]QJD73249.1 osmoprotectant ABC transporter substrate-binding protein [Lactobacillus acetotolerans]